MIAPNPVSITPALASSADEDGVSDDSDPQRSVPVNADRQEALGRQAESRVGFNDAFELFVQRLFGWLFLLPVGLALIALMRWRYGLRIEGRALLRKRFLELAKSRQPLIVCPNHLTLVDSIIIMWALCSIPRYLVNYRLFCWNIPAIENFKTRWSWRLVTYLGKCIPIDRQGGAQHIEGVFAKLRHLLKCGEAVMVFPEGTRSRSGRITTENIAYGIGKILNGIRDCRVLCVYMRGKSQKSYSDFPQSGETFDLDMELIEPASSHSGLRAARDYSVQIISKLKEMEDRYFLKHADR